MKRTGTRPKIVVTADWRGVVGHVGARLLTDLADATGLSESVSESLLALRQRASAHDPGRIALDVAVMLADGGQAIADLAVLRGQDELFGPVASASTVWRLLNALDEAALARLRAARARAREVAWAQADEAGRWQTSSVAGQTIAGLVLDVDGTIVICHSDKELASKTRRTHLRIAQLWPWAADLATASAASTLCLDPAPEPHTPHRLQRTRGTPATAPAHQHGVGRPYPRTARTKIKRATAAALTNQRG